MPALRALGDARYCRVPGQPQCCPSAPMVDNLGRGPTSSTWSTKSPMKSPMKSLITLSRGDMHGQTEARPAGVDGADGS
jgi:hypothetical protein